MNSLRGKFGSYSTSTSRSNAGDISQLSLRELMAEEFPVDPFLARRKLLPYPASKPFIDDEPRLPYPASKSFSDNRSRLPYPASKSFINDEPRLPYPASKPFIDDRHRLLETRDYPLNNQRDRGTLSLTEYANSLNNANRSEDPRRYGGSFTRERPYPDRGLDREFKGMNNSQEFKGMNNSHYGEMYGSYGNGGHYRNSEQEQYRPYERQDVNKQESGGLNLSESGGLNLSASGGLNLSESGGLNLSASGGLNLSDSGGLNLSEYVNKLFTGDESSNVFPTNTRNEKKKAVEDFLLVQDTASAEIPDYVKTLLAKVLSREKTAKKESVESSGTGEENQSQSDDKSPKTDLAEYVQMLYARIESDREKILKYEDLLQQGTAKEENTESEKNPGERQSIQSSKISTVQSNEPDKEKNKSPEKSQGNTVTAQPIETEPAKELDSSSDCIVIEEVVPVKPPLPRPPKFPSLTEGLVQHQISSETSSRDYQPRRGLASRSPAKSRSRSPRSYRRKSPERVSISPRRLSRSPPRKVRSRSPKGYKHGSRSPKNSKTSSNSSNKLLGALKLIISAIKRTNTDYSLDMLQDGVAVDFFHLPSALKVSVLVCGFQVKLNTSPNAHGYHWTMLRDVLEFSQGCDLNHEVYVEANAHEDSVDIHDTKAYELAEYFRDTDVTIDFQTLDKSLVREFQQTLQGNHWSRLHPTQNIPGPSRPSIFSRLGSRS